MKRGWIPDVLPASAESIHEEHNLDSNRTWGTFAFAANDRVWLLRLQRVSGDGDLTVPSPSRSWWKLDAVTIDDLKKSGFDVFVHEQQPVRTGGPPDRVYFAVHQEQGRAFFWRGSM